MFPLSSHHKKSQNRIWFLTTELAKIWTVTIPLMEMSSDTFIGTDSSVTWQIISEGIMAIILRLTFIYYGLPDPGQITI